MNETEVGLPPALGLRGPDGAALAVDGATLRVLRGDDGRLAEVRLAFAVDLARWERIDRDRLFRLDPAVRGPCFGGGFEPGGAPVEIEARLDPGLAGVLDATGGDAFGMADKVAAAPEDDALRATESWYALTAKQERTPGVKAGFKTTWLG